MIFKPTHSEKQLKISAELPALSVITVCFNAQSSIEKTIKSVLAQSDSRFEYIVIDGNSHDETKQIIDKYIDGIDFFVSKPDRGIYDAMNSGVEVAKGEWVIFLNAGDTFNDSNVLEDLITRYLKSSSADFLYSDVCLVDSLGKKSVYKCDHKRVIINHQCSIYKKSLHKYYGMYLVANKVTISDYLFFSLIPSSSFEKVDRIIANYDTTGISQGVSTVHQKFTIDFLMGKIGIVGFVLRLFLYDYYKKSKKLWTNLL